MKNPLTNKKSIFSFILVTLIYINQTSAAEISIFTDRLSWEAAVGNFSTENFDDPLLNPELSVFSTAGHNVTDGTFNGVVYEGDFAEDTLWSFSNSIIAFGGNWDLSPQSPGTGLEIIFHGASESFSAPTRPDITNSYSGEFWGILSNTPFEYIQVLSANLGSEHYSLDNMVYSTWTIPEPNTLLLLIISLFGFAKFENRIRKSLVIQ